MGRQERCAKVMVNGGVVGMALIEIVFMFFLEVPFWLVSAYFGFYELCLITSHVFFGV